MSRLQMKIVKTLKHLLEYETMLLVKSFLICCWNGLTKLSTLLEGTTSTAHCRQPLILSDNQRSLFMHFVTSRPDFSWKRKEHIFYESGGYILTKLRQILWLVLLFKSNLIFGHYSRLNTMSNRDQLFEY